MAKQSVALTWEGKDEPPRSAGRLVERADARTGGGDSRLIHGENLAALHALTAEFRESIAFAYFDPPYNTGNAMAHYDDDREHAAWLSFLRDRLVAARELLRADGFLCCHIDDSEGPYLKVLLDEVMGRENYLATFYVRVRYAAKTLKQDMAFHKEIEMIHAYRKSKHAEPRRDSAPASLTKFRFRIQEIGAGREIRLGGRAVRVFSKGEYLIVEGDGSPDGLKAVWASGTILDGNSSGRFFRDHLAGRAGEDGLGALYKVEGIGNDGLGHRYFTGPNRASATKGKYYQGMPIDLRGEGGSARRVPIRTFLDLAASVGNCRHEGGVAFRAGKKPEALLRRLIAHLSDPGDWVLDPFAGSGTTGAVAQKMGRRWIQIEHAEHCLTHILPRMRAVVAGEDPAGVTQAENWRGGGGFRFFEVR